MNLLSTFFFGNVSIDKQSPPPPETATPTDPATNMRIRVNGSWRYVSSLWEWHDGGWVELDSNALFLEGNQWRG